MSIRDYKITDAQIAEKGVIASPDTLTGTADENKRVFDRLVRECVAPQFNEIVETFADMEESTTEWSGEEAKRQQAEQGRVSAEAARVTAEDDRAQAESARVSAETARRQAESARDTTETARANAENKRDTAEKSRASAETGRADAEADRVSAEDTRIANENARKSAETDRASAETVRESGENARKSAEKARASAEQQRESTERTRQTAEQSRTGAETARANAEKARADAETARVSAEQARATAESKRAAAETVRQNAETGRTNAETKRVSAESARATAEGKRADAETARATAETKRVSAENARASAESTRQTNETARVSAEKSRAAAETARQTAEKARNVWEEYSAGKAYVPGNKVSFNGSSYVCTKPTTGHAPTDTAYWLLIAKKGEDGKGAGDMLASVYDPKGKAQDVFQYADAKASAAKSVADTAQTGLDAHIASKSNPHGVTAAQVGADPKGTAASTVSTHNSSTSAHSALFAKKQDKLTAGTDYATPEQLTALKTKAHKVTLTVAGWNSSTKQQTVSVGDVVADETAQLILPMPAAASMSAYNDAGIQCTAQAAGKLTFTADTVPTAAIDVYVTVTPVSFS